MRILTKRMQRDLASVFLLHRLSQATLGVSGIGEDALRRTLQLIRKERFDVVSIADIVSGKVKSRRASRGTVAFTIDDGFAEQAEVIAPIFLEYDIPVTIFVITGFVDGVLWPWDAKVSHIFLSCQRDKLTIHVGGRPLTYQLATPERALWSRRHCLELCKILSVEERRKTIAALAAAAGVDIADRPPPGFHPMTWDQARELENKGVMFGSHSVSHEILSDLDAASVSTEIGGSLLRLRQELANPLPVICWPFGKPRDFGLREIECAAEAGYLGAFSAVEGYAATSLRVPGDGFSRRRFPLPLSVNQFVGQAAGLQLMADQARAYLETIRQGMPRAWRGTYKKGAFCSVQPGWDPRGLALAARHNVLSPVDCRRVRRVVFVCKGNICRSCYAEAAARAFGLSTVSCGLQAIDGTPADSSAIRVAQRRGVPLLSHRATSLNSMQSQEGDLVVCMEPAQLRMVREHFAKSSTQVTLMGLWCRPRGLSIADPYGRHDDYFDRVFDLIDSAVAELRRRIPQADS